MEENKTKICDKCGEKKTLNFFPSRKNINGRITYRHICKICTNIINNKKQKINNKNNTIVDIQEYCCKNCNIIKDITYFSFKIVNNEIIYYKICKDCINLKAKETHIIKFGDNSLLKEKLCHNCNIIKDIDCFSLITYKSGIIYFEKNCNDCSNIKNKEYSKKYYINNKERIKLKSKKYYWDNKDKCLEQSRKNYINNREERLIQQKEYNKNNKEKIAINNKNRRIRDKEKNAYIANQNYINNREKRLIKQKEYYKNNKLDVDKYRREYEKEKYINDPIYALRKNISRHVAKGLNAIGFGKSISVNNSLSYSFEELMNYLMNHPEKEPWMTPYNRGNYRIETWDDNDDSTKTWQVDHIKPLSHFNIVSDQCEDFKKAWAKENLRPLSAKQNISEGDRRSEEQIQEILQKIKEVKNT